MQLFPVNRVFNFMGPRRYFVGASVVVVLCSIAMFFWPGPVLGTDFRGGTEIEVAFTPPIEAVEIRQAVEAAGFSGADVIHVESPTHPAQYIIRVQDVSTVTELAAQAIDRVVCSGEGLDPKDCPASEAASEVKISPGGDKVTVRFREAVDDAQLARLRERFAAQVTPEFHLELRPGANNPSVQSARDNKVELQLMSKGDQLMQALQAKLGQDRVPAMLEGDATNPLRSEWIGPKAGKQLRDSAIISVALSLVFIMAYIAFRFDLRFAPGAVLALTHDAILTVGFLTLLRHELTLSTVAAVLTIIGYSVNDTVVVYDRVRENLGRMRGASFSAIINASLSEMMSRTLLTSTTTIISLLGIFVWGTGTLKEFALTLTFGIVAGTYSSIYVALPVTYFLDQTVFARFEKKGRRIGEEKRKQTPKPATA
ncbi:MAG: protein translocase subunit SecF [Polyangiaceae bacterium]|nr:protein translocase subunit SecF [Polyangiaceae bacterium]